MLVFSELGGLLGWFVGQLLMYFIDIFVYIVLLFFVVFSILIFIKMLLNCIGVCFGDLYVWMFDVECFEKFVKDVVMIDEVDKVDDFDVLLWW